MNSQRRTAPRSLMARLFSRGQDYDALASQCDFGRYSSLVFRCDTIVPPFEGYRHKGTVYCTVHTPRSR